MNVSPKYQHILKCHTSLPTLNQVCVNSEDSRGPSKVTEFAWMYFSNSSKQKYSAAQKSKGEVEKRRWMRMREKAYRGESLFSKEDLALIVVDRLIHKLRQSW